MSKNPDKIFQSNLDKKFKNNKKIKLEGLTEISKRGNIIPKGTLVVMPSSDGQLKLKILEKDTADKGFSTPLIISENWEKQGITPNYLLWFLSRDFVIKYLKNHAQGSVFIRIPKDILYNLIIPIPTYPRKYTSKKEILIKNENDPFREFIDNFYKEYLLNMKNKRYSTAIILAGAICEALLYELLIDHGVNRKILKDDRNLGLGKLIQYVRLLKLDEVPELDEVPDFPINHFIELQKKRNSAIHVGLAVRRGNNFSIEDLSCFDQIIKYFGI